MDKPPVKYENQRRTCSSLLSSKITKLALLVSCSLAFSTRNRTTFLPTSRLPTFFAHPSYLPSFVLPFSFFLSCFSINACFWERQWESNSLVTELELSFAIFCSSMTHEESLNRMSKHISYLDPWYSALGTSIPGGTILTLFLRILRILPMLWVGLLEPQT